MKRSRKKGDPVTIKLKIKDKRKLEEITKKGEHSVRVLKRAQLLLWMGEGKTPPQAAVAVRVTAKTARAIANRYLEKGLNQAIYEDPRCGAVRLLDIKQQSQVIALVCSHPPPGHARWSIRLITQEVMNRKITPSISRECIRVLLQHHELKPWREKNVVYRSSYA